MKITPSDAGKLIVKDRNKLVSHKRKIINGATGASGVTKLRMKQVSTFRFGNLLPPEGVGVQDEDVDGPEVAIVLAGA